MMKVSILVMLLFCTVEPKTLELHVRDHISGKLDLRYDIEIEGGDIALFDVLHKYQHSSGNFRFTSVEFPDLGAYIDSINGLKEDPTLDYYWALLKLVDGEMCRSPLGASSYYPEPDDHIVFAYFTLAMFSEYPTCRVGSQDDDDMTVQISVTNMVEIVKFENMTYPVETKFNTSLINIMVELRDANENLTFTCVDYPNLGAYIDSVNGLKQYPKLNLSWAILKLVDGEMCLTPVGVSFYYPEPDEHIVFAYFTLAMFNEYLKCGDGSHDDDDMTVQNSLRNNVALKKKLRNNVAFKTKLGNNVAFKTKLGNNVAFKTKLQNKR